MELEHLTQVIPELGMVQALTLWALILALREIRRLYQLQIKEKEHLCRVKDDENTRLQKELQAYQQKLSDAFEHHKNTPS